MIEFVLKIVLITFLYWIFHQDRKDRLVYWFLYPLTGIFCFSIHAKTVGVVPAFTSAMINLTLVGFVVFLAFIYTKLVIKKRFLNESIGSGDLLFFACLSFAFSIVAFIVLFVFSLIFTLILHNTQILRQADKTVPLAGYMALFFASVYLTSFFIEPKYLFSY